MACPVCLSEYPIAPCVTPCGHKFCTECIELTFKSHRPWNRGSCPMCRAAVSLHDTRAVASNAVLREPPVSTIFGNVYLQGGSLGVASYHFDSVEQPYISYAAAPAHWLLDDGTAPPERCHFESTSYDEASRTFEGTIHWTQSPFAGDSEWRYTMVFSDDFSIICGGQLQSFDANGQQTQVSRFPTDLCYWRSHELPVTLDGCAFMQGGLLGLASYHFDQGVEEAYISYEAAPSNWSLDDGSTPPKIKRFVEPAYDASTRTFTGTIHWTPATFNGSARWDYTLTFAEDYTSIVDGQVRVFGEDEEELKVLKVGEGQSLDYKLYVEEEAQMWHYQQNLSDQ